MAIALLISLGVSLAVSCEQGKPTVVVDGSSTVYPLVDRAAEAYHQIRPETLVETTVSGTVRGIEKFCRGKTDIATASRQITRQEAMDCASAGIKFREIPIALDGIAVVVHPDNHSVNSITIEELQRIYSADDFATNWSDLRSSWPRKRIQPYSPGKHNGTQDFFRMAILNGDTLPLRSDVITATNPSVLASGIAESPNAIGYFSLGYYYRNKSKLKLLSIINPMSHRKVTPGPNTVRDGDYAPLSRPLFLYVRERSLKKTAVRNYLEFFLENAIALSVKTGHIPFEPEVYEVIRKRSLSDDTTAMFELEEDSSLDNYRLWIDSLPPARTTGGQNTVQ